MQCEYEQKMKGYREVEQIYGHCRSITMLETFFQKKNKLDVRDAFLAINGYWLRKDKNSRIYSNIIDKLGAAVK